MGQQNKSVKGIGGTTFGQGRRRGSNRRNRVVALAATAAASASVVLVAPARAATRTWTAAGSGNWSTNTNWSNNTLPAVTGDSVNVTDAAAGIKTVTFDGAVTTTSVVGLTIGGTVNTFTGQMTLQFPSGSVKTLAVTTETVGGTSTGGGKGTVQQDGATQNITTLNIGDATQGVFNLTGGTVTAGTENLGNTGNGSFTQTAGTHTATTFNIGTAITGVGGYTLSGVGALNSTTEVQAVGGNSTFTQTGGTHTVTNLSLGSLGGSTANYNLFTGAATIGNGIFGVNGTGLMSQSGGTVTVNGAGGSDGLILGQMGGSVGSDTMTGGTLNVTATTGLTVAKGGTALLDHSAGAVTVGTGPANRNLLIGTDIGGNGSYGLSGSASLTVNGNCYVGGNAAIAGGTGAFNIGAGTASISGTLKIWNTSGTTLGLSGGSLSVGALDTGASPGVFTWSAGTLNITGASGLTIGAAGPLGATPTIASGMALGVTNVTTLASAAAVITVNGGSFTTSSLSGPGTVNYDAGNFTLTGSGLLIDNSGPLGASITIPAGSSVTVSGALNNNGTVTLNGGNVGGASVLNNTGVISGAGILTGAGGITNGGLVMLSGGNVTVTKTGTFLNNSAGVLQLDAGRQLQLNGGDLQNSGTVNLDGGGNINSLSAFSLINNADGLITGAGNISVPLSNAGTIAITSGTLNVTNGFTNNGMIELDGVTAKLLVGGTGVNNGASAVIEGHGRLSGALVNAGRVEAIGGSLTLAGTTTNNAGGMLVASSGNTLLISGAPGSNAGIISLTGGALDTNHQAITNAASGAISGRGTIRTGGLTNNGQIQLSGGATDVYGNLTGNSGSKVILTGAANASFYNPVTMNSGSEFRVNAGTTASFFANVTGTSFFTGAGLKDFEAGSSSVAALITSGSSTVQNGAALTATVIRESALSVSGQVTVLPNGTPSGTSNLGTLSVTSPGRLDLHNNNLVIQNASLGSWNGTAYTGVTGLIQSGRNGGGGLWNGSGIVTSESSALSGLTTLAAATADQLGVAGGTWSGQPVSSGNVLVKYTYGGDANLDGKINVDDYGKIDFAIPLGLTGWSNGDFNLDGKLNVDDYGIIDFNVGIQGAPFLSSSSVVDAPSLNVVSVPEPTGLGLVLLAGGAISARRRRRAC